MKKYLLAFILLSSLNLKAQTPEDILRWSWFAPNGTPRSNALSGAMGSLGGDLSSANINPAGLGFYKSGELLFSAKYLSNNNKFNYGGNNSSTNDTKSTFSNIGFVSTIPAQSKAYSSSAFSISYNKLADYNNRIQFKGANYYSSFSEKFVEELNYGAPDFNAAENDFIFGSSLAFRTYLVDTIANPSGYDRYQSLAMRANGVEQQYDLLTSGSYDELSFGWGGSIEDKLFLGASLVFPVINYNKSLQYTEVDIESNNKNNDFGGFIYNENFSTKGWGIGAKLGLIYKPETFLRFGFALHTPQLISFRDKKSVALEVNTENYAGFLTANSNDLNDGYPGIADYTVTTPMKTIFSTSYFFAAQNKPTQPLGFISADIEWVNYAGSRMYSNTYDEESANYYDEINTIIKETYKNNINIKIGSEIKIQGNWMLRAGTAYYGSPYRQEFKDEKDAYIVRPAIMSLSGGLGYRTNKYFIDFTIANTTSRDAVFPYRLYDKENVLANQSSNQMVFNIGYGIRF